MFPAMNTSPFASRPPAFNRRDFLARCGMGMGTVGLAGLLTPFRNHYLTNTVSSVATKQ